MKRQGITQFPARLDSIPLLCALGGTLVSATAAGAAVGVAPRPQLPPPPPARKQRPCHTLITPSQIHWVREKAFPTLKFAYLQGNPAQPGPYTMRVWIPPHSVMPPHFHPQDEVGTVITGTFYTGAGSVLDRKRSQALPAGSIGIVPKGCRHFAWTRRGITIVQVHGIGPWEMIRVNPDGSEQPKHLTLAGPKP